MKQAHKPELDSNNGRALSCLVHACRTEPGKMVLTVDLVPLMKTPPNDPSVTRWVSSTISALRKMGYDIEAVTEPGKRATWATS